MNECLESVFQQVFKGTLELSVYDDGSQDNSLAILEDWKDKLKNKQIKCCLLKGETSTPKGVGYARNRAVEKSSGRFLCFLDADDVMAKERIQVQYDAAQEHPEALIGSGFHREPPGSTQRYTQWANTRTEEQLGNQIYTSHGPTIAMPTWFCSRKQFDKVGGFSEKGKGIPEDLIFFYKHLDLSGQVTRVNADLMKYRYHPECTTFSISEDTIWDLRLERFECKILAHWSHLTIWNAGKKGRKFYRSLTPENKKKVIAFCDVDVKKIQKGIYIYEESKEVPKPRIPIIHFHKAKPPIVLCMKMDLTRGNFEENLASLKLKENIDYHYFS